GKHAVSYWSTDKATNEETHHTTATIKVDTVKPSTSIALTPASPDGSNGFYSSTPSFTLSASDATSGVYASYYQLDGGATQAYSGAVAIPAAEHTVSSRPSGNAGNE